MSGHHCFHCGELCAHDAVQATIAEQEQWFCCNGCSAVAQMITGNGLQAVYENRTGFQPSLAQQKTKVFTWYQEAIAEDKYTSASNGARHADLLIQGLSCGACVWLCEQSLSRMAGVNKAIIRFEANRLVIDYDPTNTSLATLCAAIEALGYSVKPFEQQSQEQYFKASQHQLLTRVGVSGLGMMLTVMLAVAMHLGAAQGTQSMSVALGNFMLYASSVVSGLIILFCGWPFFKGTKLAIRQGILSMDVTIAAALVLAWGMSVADILRSALSLDGVVFYQQVTYYESLVMLLFFILVNRYSELRIRHKNLADLNAMKQTQALMVERFNGDSYETVSGEHLVAGDEIRVQAGQVIPADALVLQGTAEMDESLLNGEFTPVTKAQGDRVLAGSLITSHELSLRITAVGEATQVSAIESLVNQAIENKPKIVSLADRSASRFLSLVVLIAFIAGVAWSFIDSGRVFEVVLSILIAACPCALAIATPSAIARASLALRQQGVLLRDADVLFRLATIRRWIFDKTGTLTDIKPTVDRVDRFADSYSEQQAFDIAAALEAGNQHIVASVFQAHTALLAVDLQSVAGQGVEATVGDSRFRIGKPQFIQQWHPDFSVVSDAKMPVVLASEQEPIAVFWLDEQLKRGAGIALSQLATQAAINVLSGDVAKRGKIIVDRLGLAAVQAEYQLSANDKHARIQHWQHQGVRCAMVGDGVNDAPAMAAADLSISMNQASDLTKTQADVVLLNTELHSLTTLVETAARCRRVVNQGFYWSLIYNVVALSLAALGLLSPLLAVIGMVASSALVLLNAKRVGNVIEPKKTQRLPPRLDTAGVAV